MFNIRKKKAQNNDKQSSAATSGGIDKSLRLTITRSKSMNENIENNIIEQPHRKKRKRERATSQPTSNEMTTETKDKQN